MVHEPAVGQNIQRGLRCFHVYRAQGVYPVILDVFQLVAAGLKILQAPGKDANLLEV